MCTFLAHFLRQRFISSFWAMKEETGFLLMGAMTMWCCSLIGKVDCQPSGFLALYLLDGFIRYHLRLDFFFFLNYTCPPATKTYDLNFVFLDVLLFSNVPTFYLVRKYEKTLLSRGSKISLSPVL